MKLLYGHLNKTETMTTLANMPTWVAEISQDPSEEL